MLVPYSWMVCCAQKHLWSCNLDMLGSLDLTMDDNKENQTPDGGQGELDWAQQYSLDQEREEQELQQALAQSLQEHVCLFYPFDSSLT